MVDDAHGIGVLGQRGVRHRRPFWADRPGSLDHGHLQQVAGQPGRIYRLRRGNRGFSETYFQDGIFSASMSPANAAAVLAAVKSWSTSRSASPALGQHGADEKRTFGGRFRFGASQTPILPVYTRDMLKPSNFAADSNRKGSLSTRWFSPECRREGDAAVSLMATHTNSQIDFGLEKFQKIGKELDHLGRWRR